MRLRSSPLHPVKGSHLAHALELDPEQHRPTRRRLAKAHWCPRASFRLHTIRQAGPAAKVVHCGHESRSAPVIFCLASMAVGTVRHPVLERFEPAGASPGQVRCDKSRRWANQCRGRLHDARARGSRQGEEAKFSRAALRRRASCFGR